MKSKKKFILFICCIAILLFGISIKASYDRKASEKEDALYEYDEFADDDEESDDDSDDGSNNRYIYGDDKDILIGATQLAIEDHGFDDDTSTHQDDWEFSIGNQGGEDIWNVVTQKTDLVRIKAMYEWSGDENDDLILIYLLINGDEIVNKL